MGHTLPDLWSICQCSLFLYDFNSFSPVIFVEISDFIWLVIFVLIVAKVYWSWCIMTTIFLVNILFQLHTCIRCFFICWGCSVLLLAQSSVSPQFPVNMCDTCFNALSFFIAQICLTFDICWLLLLDDS